ncbi:FAD-dependent oxidoreductase [Salinifilum ghardaiensis]
MAEVRAPVLVIGAGVMGLTTGIVLAEAGWPVRIRTSEPPAETASAAAAAMWAPAMLEPRERVVEWVSRTHAELVRLAEDPETGVHLAGGRIAARFDLSVGLPREAELVPNLRRCTANELPAPFLSGYHGTFPLVDMLRYLDYLVRRFRGAGGELLRSEVPVLADAAAESDRVVNCAGIGARMFGDPSVVPVWGQQVVVENPGVEEFLLEIARETEFVSIMPHADRVVLGGIAAEHEWSTAPDHELSERIMARCARVEPRLSRARRLEERVGLRPARPRVRVEAEDYAGARIVHNYGHGGSGVALSWGCAHAAAELVGR